MTTLRTAHTYAVLSRAAYDEIHAKLAGYAGQFHDPETIDMHGLAVETPEDA